MIRDLEIGKVK